MAQRRGDHVTYLRLMFLMFWKSRNTITLDSYNGPHVLIITKVTVKENQERNRKYQNYDRNVYMGLLGAWERKQSEIIRRRIRTTDDLCIINKYPSIHLANKWRYNLQTMFALLNLSVRQR